MLYSDYTITISARHGVGYSVSAVTEGMGRIARILPDPPAELTILLAEVEALPADGGHGEMLKEAGTMLFRWLMSPMETHFRVAWDRAEQQKSGMRLRLSIDAPEINAWPWELLHDPQRGRTFATSIATPIVRYLDRADQFGSLAELRADLPLRMLLVLPEASDLNLAKERSVIEQAIAPLAGTLKLDILDRAVTRARFADALMGGHYEIVHGSGHGAFLDGEGFIGLNHPDGSPDWVNGEVLGRFVVNSQSLKLGVLNVCSSGKVDEGRAFQGLAPQLVRAGLPAVVAMQSPLTDDAAMAFSEEFYRRLCVGENAGRVDAAVTYARNMLAILYPGDRCFAAPVIYTHAPDGVIFTPQPPVESIASSRNGDEADAAGTFLESMRRSAAFEDDLMLADHRLLEDWRSTLTEATEHYHRHLIGPDPSARTAAQQGLALLRQRLYAIDARLASE